MKIKKFKAKEGRFQRHLFDIIEVNKFYFYFLNDFPLSTHRHIISQSSDNASIIKIHFDSYLFPDNAKNDVDLDI